LNPGHPALPPAVSRPWLGCAAAVTLASWAAAWPRFGLYLVALLVVGLALARMTVVATLVAVAALASSLAATPLQPLPAGRVEGRGVMATDVIEGRYGPYALVDLSEGPVLVDLNDGVSAAQGAVVEIEGVVDGDPGTIRGKRHRGAVDVGTFTVVSGPVSPIMIVGNAMRDRVTQRLAPLEGGRALLAGFLVGDTRGVDDVDESAMRRAGLAHFTAVSGSNVALFLGLLYVAAGPIGIGPRKRAVVGLIGLPFFAAATRFEPSVLRASAMAALALGGRMAGIAMETWQLFSTAIIGLVVLDPALIRNIGFQLSVVATAGVIVGSRWPVPSGRTRRALAVTIGAQTAVAPLLVLHFGLVPLLSPLANLVVAPLVAVSTVLGAIGVVGPESIADLGAWLAGVVLLLARVASAWPQIGWSGLAIVFVAVLLYLRLPRLRGVIAIASAAVLAVLVLGPTRAPPDAGVVVLDVGQGDSILISGGEGRFALVDGGPDPVTLVESLHDYGVRGLDLVVLTHVHADHATGLNGLVGRIPVGSVWARTHPHESGASDELFRLLHEAGIPVVEPRVGESHRLGDLTLTVDGPIRRYASPNDQSIVVTVTGSTRSMLLAGDIETVAQADLEHLRADVLKVPHQGAATSDPEWLRNVGAELAVISVGPNDFGHPSDWVIAALEESGAIVVRTDVEGDVVVPLG
jgi:competence protein ComEC